ncbi:uncharacterized protein BO88DRAFT_98737 [Aspergillus vadensis CBS 113365]|uniref:Uncharacterized protein n=1 Tax=Aspergillus vadensis (strain CBS 113365 / IMI 142717 / IBT 24658) TaxID=1448311 RepID=A0A319CDV9_ASPVC|nr:hypothetical protein BO88DRAFT_98737 [Aspergillus vadensis CBS 113365]PYH73518.1 hypothetical protein BO88DRAFT_98737 [Aspergillus vadensis CBS 113365]
MIMFTLLQEKLARSYYIICLLCLFVCMGDVDAGGKVGRRIHSFHSCLPRLPKTHFSLLQLSSLGGTEAVPGISRILQYLYHYLRVVYTPLLFFAIMASAPAGPLSICIIPVQAISAKDVYAYY